MIVKALEMAMDKDCAERTAASSHDVIARSDATKQSIEPIGVRRADALATVAEG